MLRSISRSSLFWRCRRVFRGYDEHAATIVTNVARNSVNVTCESLAASATAARNSATRAVSPGGLKRQGTVAIEPAKRDYADGRDPEVVKRIDEIRLALLNDSAKKLHFERSIARFCRVQEDQEDPLSADEIREIVREVNQEIRPTDPNDPAAANPISGQELRQATSLMRQLAGASARA